VHPYWKWWFAVSPTGEYPVVKRIAAREDLDIMQKIDLAKKLLAGPGEKLVFGPNWKPPTRIWPTPTKLDLLIYPDHPFQLLPMIEYGEETKPTKSSKPKPIQAVKVKTPKFSKPVQAVKIKPVTRDLKKPVIKSSLIKHPYHILDWSPFPFLVGLFTFSWLVPLVFFLHGLDCPIVPNSVAIHLSFCGLFYTVMAWFLAIVKESAFHHTRKVQHGLRMGVFLFIVSEVMLFFSFFWAFFHVSLIPAITVGAMWPPVGTQILDVWGLPFVNTLLLLTSGVTITIAHAYLIKKNYSGFSWNLLLTILLGVTFLICQGYEYKYGVKFSWRENIYGSIFFITTGFHGMHVTVGTLLLAFCWTRNYLSINFPRQFAILLYGKRTVASTLSPHKHGQTLWGFTPKQHIGFEAAAWYWHFVDVVWLFLFITIYWWGGRL
jgi:heme/copper-type cytochrome/quinol oxidase subunit 3